MSDNFEHKVHDAASEMGQPMLNVLYMLDISDNCEKCYYFNPDIHERKQMFDCHERGTGIATTLHPDIQQKIWDNLKIS